MDEPHAYLNGQFLPASRLMISPTDAGFMLGVTVAEQIRSFGGTLFRLDEHLARLHHSLKIVGVDPGFSTTELAAKAEHLVECNYRLLEPGDDLGLSVFVTPGAYASFESSQEAGPTVCMHTYPLAFRLWASKYRTGQSLVTTDVRQVPSSCWPVALKCRSRMHYYLADQQAASIEPGARALLLDGEGWVVEASTANLVIYREEEGLISPPRDKILPGISLAVLEELALALEIPSIQRNLKPADVAGAAEVILTSTSCCLLPVTQFNGHSIGRGRPGSTFTRLIYSWGESVGLDIISQAEQFEKRHPANTPQP